MPIRTFDDLTQGERFLVGRCTPSRAEAIELATRFEPQPHHVDAEAAHASVFGGLTLCSLHLFAVCTRLFFDMKDPIAVLAMMGKDELRLPAPARPDEELAYTCRYTNTLDVGLVDGESAVNEEMCMAIGWYFPGDGKNTYCAGNASATF